MGARGTACSRGQSPRGPRRPLPPPGVTRCSGEWVAQSGTWSWEPLRGSQNGGEAPDRANAPPPTRPLLPPPTRCACCGARLSLEPHDPADQSCALLGGLQPPLDSPPVPWQDLLPFWKEAVVRGWQDFLGTRWRALWGLPEPSALKRCLPAHLVPKGPEVWEPREKS